MAHGDDNDASYYGRELERVRNHVQDVGAAAVRALAEGGVMSERLASAVHRIDRVEIAVVEERRERESAVTDARNYAAALVSDHKAELTAAREHEQEQARHEQEVALKRAALYVGLASILGSSLVAIAIAVWQGIHR